MSLTRRGYRRTESNGSWRRQNGYKRGVPRYSVVIPTLARADTLEHALATVLTQTLDDFEVVVQNNGDDAATLELV